MARRGSGGYDDIYDPYDSYGGGADNGGTTVAQNPTQSPDPYAQGGTTPIQVPPGLNIKPGPVAGQKLPTGTAPATTGFGDLTDPSVWMGLVGNDSQLGSWITSILPGATPDQIKIWSDYIKEKPGANVTEQAGSAEYWKQRMLAGNKPDSGGAGGATITSPQDPAEHDAILKLLMQGQNPVTGADVEGLYRPASNAIERGGVQARAASAQRRAVEGTGAQGGGGGANDSDVNSINEDIAGKQGTLMSQLMGDEINRRRQDVINALQFAQGDDRIKLQAELANLDNQHFYDQFSYTAGRDTHNDDTLAAILKLLTP